MAVDKWRPYTLTKIKLNEPGALALSEGIPLSWGCTGNALSNHRSIDDEESLARSIRKRKETQSIRNIHGISNISATV